MEALEKLNHHSDSDRQTVLICVCILFPWLHFSVLQVGPAAEAKKRSSSKLCTGILLDRSSFDICYIGFVASIFSSHFSFKLVPLAPSVEI